MTIASARSTRDVLRDLLRSHNTTKLELRKHQRLLIQHAPPEVIKELAIELLAELEAIARVDAEEDEAFR